MFFKISNFDTVNYYTYIVVSFVSERIRVATLRSRQPPTKTGIKLLLMKISTFKKLYHSLPSEIFCGALDSSIKITRTGFQHVFYGKRRNGEDITMRGKCIKLIQPLLETTTLYQWHSKQFVHNGDIEYWNFQGVVKGICIHVTIRQIGNQNKHLYSWHSKGLSPKMLSNNEK